MQDVDAPASGCQDLYREDVHWPRAIGRVSWWPSGKLYVCRDWPRHLHRLARAVSAAAFRVLCARQVVAIVHLVQAAERPQSRVCVFRKQESWGFEAGRGRSGLVLAAATALPLASYHINHCTSNALTK